MSKSGSLSRSGFTSSRTINVTSPMKPETKSKLEVQNLRQLLQDRMVEYSTLDSEWHTQEAALANECEERVSQLRDIELQFKAAENAERTKHLATMRQAKSEHRAARLDLHAQIDASLSQENHDEVEDLDNEIAALKNELSQLDIAPALDDDLELVDEDAEERIRVLEDRLDEKQQLHDEVMRQRDEDSRSATRMIEQLVAKNQEAERAHEEQIQEMIETLNKLDKDQADRTADLEGEIADERKQITTSMRSAKAKIARIQGNISKRQREYNRTVHELHDQADQLRSALEVLTARQKQQMKEAQAVAKRFADEKKRFVSMHRELEMLNAELVRETVEHETLMKEVSKMDTYLLSQMTAGTKVGTSTFSSIRSSRF